MRRRGAYGSTVRFGKVPRFEAPPNHEFQSKVAAGWEIQEHVCLE